MRESGQPCPYCGVWHSSASHPPQFGNYVFEILSLEKRIEELEKYEALYNEVAKKLNDANFIISEIKKLLVDWRP